MICVLQQAVSEGGDGPGNPQYGLYYDEEKQCWLRFALEMMNFVFKMMNCVSKVMNCVLNTMDSVLK